MIRKRGFSLTEVIVATTILGISLLTIYGVYFKTFSASSRSEMKSAANATAQEKMEKILNMPYAKIALWANSSPAPASSYTFTNQDETSVVENTVLASTGIESDYITHQEQVIKNGETFTITTTITWHDDADDYLATSTPTPDPDPNDYKRVHVTVSWPGANKPVVIDRFVSMYFRPFASATAGANAGDFRLDDDSNYVSIGSTSLENHTGGNKTSSVEAKGFSIKDKNCGTDYSSCTDIPWVKEYTDDDASTSSPESVDDSETVYDSSFNDPSFDISMREPNSYSTASVSSGTLTNIIDGSPSWHSGDLVGSGLWDSWPTPPTWTTDWNEPSAIAKTDFVTDMDWKYSPVHSEGYKMFDTDDGRAGSKSAITSGATIKVVARSWSQIKDVEVIQMPGGFTEGVIEVGNVMTTVEVEASASTGGKINTPVTESCEIENFHIRYGGSPSDVFISSLTDQSQIPATLPEPIQSITVCQQSQSTDATSAQHSVTALVIKINENSSLLSGITIPASTATLGIAEASVSHTMK